MRRIKAYVRGSALIRFAAGVVLVAAIAAGGYGWMNRSTDGPSGPAEPVKLALIGTYPGSALIHVAQAKGYFSAEGLAVTLLSLATGKATMDALARGEADFASAGDLPLMFAIAKGESVSILATISTSQRDHGVAVQGGKGVRSAADLKGKRIAYSAGTSSQFVLDSMLLRAGLSTDEVKLVNLKPDEMPAALSGGTVDAASTWEPTLGKLKNETGPGGVVFYSDGIYVPYMSVTSKREFAVASPETVKKLLRALVRAERLYINEPEAAVRAIAQATQLGIDQVRSQLSIYQIGMTLDQSLLTALEGEAHWAGTSKLIGTMTAPQFLDNFHMPGLLAVKPEGVTLIR